MESLSGIKVMCFIPGARGGRVRMEDVYPPLLHVTSFTCNHRHLINRTVSFLVQVIFLIFIIDDNPCFFPLSSFFTIILVFSFHISKHGFSSTVGTGQQLLFSRHKHPQGWRGKDSSKQTNKQNHNNNTSKTHTRLKNLDALKWTQSTWEIIKKVYRVTDKLIQNP